jgi:hypothetical protein
VGVTVLYVLGCNENKCQYLHPYVSYIQEIVPAAFAGVHWQCNGGTASGIPFNTFKTTELKSKCTESVHVSHCVHVHSNYFHVNMSSPE